MSYLLDSHILYWIRLEPRKISKSLRALFDDASEQIFYSVITPWEFSIKHAKGLLPLPHEFFDMSGLGFESLPVEEYHIDSLRTLPALHNDPFDRMLLAQAQAEKLIFITADKRLTVYPVKMLIAES